MGRTFRHEAESIRYENTWCNMMHAYLSIAEFWDWIYFTCCHCWVLWLDLFHMLPLLHSSFIGWVEHFGTKPSLLDMKIHDVTWCTHTSVLLSSGIGSISQAVTVEFCDCISFTCCHCRVMWLDLFHIPSLLFSSVIGSTVFHGLSLLSSVFGSLSHAVTIT